MALALKSGTIRGGGAIPKRYTCEEAGISPPLHWDDPPAGTRSFALILDDPDAPSGPFTHWMLYALPAETCRIPENVIPDDARPDGSRQGKNSAGRTGYSGPCPPEGVQHRYAFDLYALDAPLHLAAGATKAELIEAMAGHIIAEAQLTGLYALPPGVPKNRWA